jgi:hypothetical protein
MDRRQSFLQSAILLAAMLATPTLVGSAYGQNTPAAPDPAAPTPVPAAPAPAATPAAPAAGQPSADVLTMITDIQANLETKQYPEAVKIASKVLALKGPAAAGVDRFEIMMQKGYAQAGMKSMSSAGITFKLAMKETKDPHQIALAKWTADLFKTAGSTTYTPKALTTGGQKRGPFDLLDADQRKDAFGAFLEDNLSILEPKVKEATISQKLVDIFPVLQQIIDLDQLDQIANSSDDKTSTLASGLLDHARNLLTNALKSDWSRVNDIDTHANIVTTIPTQVVINNSLVTQTTSRKNGLSDSNRSELQNFISVCQKIHDAAEAFLPLAKTDKDWSTIISDADRVAARASDVLNADYGGTTTSGSTVTDNGSGIGNGIGVGIGGNSLSGTSPIYPGGTTPQVPQNPRSTNPQAQPTKPTEPAKPTAPADPPPTNTRPPMKPPIKVPGA